MPCGSVGYNWKTRITLNVSLRLESSIGRVHGNHCRARHSGWHTRSGTILSNIIHARRSRCHPVSQGIVSSIKQDIKIYWIDLLGWLDFESHWSGLQTRAILCLGTNRRQVCSTRKTATRRTCLMRSLSVDQNGNVTQATRMGDCFMQLEQFDKAIDLLASIDRVSSAFNQVHWTSSFNSFVIRSMNQLNSPFAAKSHWQKNHSSAWVLRNVWHIWHSYPIGIRTTIFSLAANEEDMPPYRATCEKLGDLAADQGAYGVTTKKYLDAGNKIKVGRSFPYDMNDISCSSWDCSPSVQWSFRAMSIESLSWPMFHGAIVKPTC